MSLFLHDPDATLDYTWDWSTWLGDSGDTIASATITASAGITVDSTTQGDTAVTVVISTDETTGPRSVACKITTLSGLTDERTIQINVQER